MFITLMKKDEPVCKLSLGCLSLTGISIYKYEMINIGLMPFLCDSLQDEDDVKDAIADWLEGRAIANENPALDQTMFTIYDLDPSNYGRMYEYQYLGAFMAYMVSNEDDYWVNPDFTQVLSYVLIDHDFCKGYIFKPVENYKVAKKEGRGFELCLRHPLYADIPNQRTMF